MKEIEKILSVANERGVMLKAHGLNIQYVAPAGTMTAEFVRSLKAHKKDILKILKQDMLPTACPITTGKITPGVAKRCRFETKFLQRLTTEGVISFKTGCPIVGNCGLISPWPRKKAPASAKLKCLGFNCKAVEYVRKPDHPPVLWCTRSTQAVIKLAMCPKGYWKRGLKRWPVTVNKACSGPESSGAKTCVPGASLGRTKHKRNIKTLNRK